MSSVALAVPCSCDFSSVFEPGFRYEALQSPLTWNAGMQSFTTWWSSFSAVMVDYWAGIGPREYGYVLIVTAFAGYLFLKSSSR